MKQDTLANVLVVDDDIVSGELLTNCLNSFGYSGTYVTDGKEAVEQIRTGRFRLVISDWEMPELDGIELCKFIRSRSAGYIYVILLTSRSGTSNIVEGLNAGADDFVTKPFEPEELRVRLRVAERVLSLEGRDMLIFSLAKLAESRDSETGAHLERIRQYSKLLAEKLADSEKYRDQVDGEFVQLIYLTSPLHDIGKVGIPDHILCNPGRLSPEEFEIMQQHTVIGGETLDAAAAMDVSATFLGMARDIAWHHHEKYDGSGYPDGLAGEEIPLAARIVSLADVYDALRSKRVYKDAFSHKKAREIIFDGSGSHFDPDVVDAFLRCEEQFIHTCQALQNPEEMESLAGV